MAGAGETWAKALRNMSPTQLARGIEACAESSDDWPPTLPQFRTMCLGIPALAAVRRELSPRGGDRSPFTRLVWQHLDTVRWRAATEDGADRLLREAYGEAHEFVMRGGALPDESVALPEPAPVDHAARAIREMEEFAKEWDVQLPKVSEATA